MKYRTSIATALVAVAATLFVPGQAQAQTTAVRLGGHDHGVGYTVGTSADTRSALVSLDSGTFTFDRAAGAFLVHRGDGAVVAALPTRWAVGGARVELSGRISSSGRSVTLVAGPRHPSAAERWNAALQNATLGAIAGAGIGLIGIMLFVLPVLVTVPVGAVIGFFVGGGPELVNAGLAYFGGQP